MACLDEINQQLLPLQDELNDYDAQINSFDAQIAAIQVQIEDVRKKRAAVEIQMKPLTAIALRYQELENIRREIEFINKTKNNVSKLTNYDFRAQGIRFDDTGRQYTMRDGRIYYA